MAEVTVLIVDDDESIRDMLRLALELAGFVCLEADNTYDAHCQIVDEDPDIVLLDWMLPGGSGIELLRRLKREENTRDVAVIMLTAKTSEDNIIQGLEVGADDYLTKPFAPRELIARIQAILRRTAALAKSERIQLGDVVLDGDSQRVFVEEEQLSVGPTEFRLLQFFMTHPDRAYTRSQLLDRVWGNNVYVEERTVDVHIRRLRKALQSASIDCSAYVETVRGTGYRFYVQGVRAE
ncbi:MAG: phosphate regulon transcriptional regulator PhoB [Halioglobus sp.]